MNYIIMYNYGYGDVYEVVDAGSLEEAEQMAYTEWREGAESNASYSAFEYTEELAENYL